MVDREEQQFVRLAIKGDAQAYGVLYDRYQSKIYRFILLKVGVVAEAQDLTHQVFLHALTHIGSYQDIGHPFGSWLYKIARNQIIDHYRTRKDQPSLDEDGGEERFSAFLQSDDLAQETQTRMEMERVAQAIQQLKPEYQDIVIMRFIEDLSIKEIAQIVEKSEGAIKLLQHRAVAALKKILNESP